MVYDQIAIVDWVLLWSVLGGLMVMVLGVFSAVILIYLFPANRKWMKKKLRPGTIHRIFVRNNSVDSVNDDTANVLLELGLLLTHKVGVCGSGGLYI